MLGLVLKGLPHQVHRPARGMFVSIAKISRSSFRSSKGNLPLAGVPGDLGWWPHPLHLGRTISMYYQTMDVAAYE